MLGMYKDESGTRCLPFLDSIITVRDLTDKVCQVSLHTPYYVNAYGETKYNLGKAYWFTVWTKWCHPYYLGQTISELMSDYDDGEHIPELRKASEFDKRNYDLVHSISEDCPLPYVVQFGSAAPATIIGAWDDCANAARSQVELEYEVYKQVTTGRYSFSYGEFKEGLQHVLNEGFKMDSPTLVENIKKYLVWFYRGER